MPATAPASAAALPLWRRLTHPIAPPAVLDFWASRLHPAWALERPLARVVARAPAASDAVTLTLQPNRHWRGFLPGQHVNLGVEVDGIRTTRSYSLVDAPRADGRIAITVKATEGGRVSRHLCTVAQVGDVFEIGPAFGDMVLPETLDAPLLMLAAGSGITPFMAILRALALRGMPVPVTLLYSARHRHEVCFLDDLRALSAAHPQLRVRFHLTGDAPASDDERAGRIDAAALSTCVDDLPAVRVFACGPGAFVEDMRTRAAPLARAFQAEAFSAPPPAAIDAGGTVQLTLSRSGRTLSVPRGQSLLTALEAQGLRPESGCRMGICNTCACVKSAGITRHLHTGTVDPEPASALRLCVNSAASDLVIDL